MFVRRTGPAIGPEPSPLNVPNAITVARTVAALVLAVLAITESSTALAVASYLCYWLGDVADGMAARRLGQETRIGAVLDIVADRACCALGAGALLLLRPDMALPIAIFLTQFLVLDCMLSLAFLYWPLLSPNYFDQVDRRVYRWNWWPPAKAVNTGGLVVLVLLAPSPVWPAALAVAVTLIKLGSLAAICRLRAAAPLPS